MKHHMELEATCADGRMKIESTRDGVTTTLFDSVADEPVKAKLADMVRLETTPEAQKDVILSVLSRWDAYTDFLPKVKGRMFVELDYEWPDDTVLPWEGGPPMSGIGLVQPVMELQALRAQARELVAAGERG